MSQPLERETRRGSGLRLKRKDKDKDKLQERPSLEQISSVLQQSATNSTGALIGVSSQGSNSTPSPGNTTPNLALSSSGPARQGHVSPIAINAANGAAGGGLPSPPHASSMSLSSALSQSSLSVNSLSPQSPRHGSNHLHSPPTSPHQTSPGEPLLSSSSSSSIINSNDRVRLYASPVELSPGKDIDVAENDSIATVTATSNTASTSSGVLHLNLSSVTAAHASNSRQALIDSGGVPEKTTTSDGMASPLLSPIMSNESISEEELIPYGSKSQLLTPSKHRDRHSRTDSSRSHEPQPKKMIHLGGLQFDRVIESIDVNGPDEDIRNYSFIYDQIQKEPEMTMEDGQMQGSLTAAIRYCVTNSKKVPIRSSNENEKSPKGLSAVVHALLWNYELFITSIQLLQIVIIYYRLAIVHQSSEREIVESNVFNFIADWILLRFDALEGSRAWKTIFFKFFKLIDQNKTGKPVSEDCLDGPKLFQYWITQRKLYLEYVGSATLPPELFKRDDSSEAGLAVSGEFSANTGPSNPRSLAPLDPMLIAKQLSKFNQIMFLHTSIEEYHQWSTRPTKEDLQPGTVSPTNTNGNREEATKPSVMVIEGGETGAASSVKDSKDSKDEAENSCKHIQAMIDWFNSIVCWVKSTLIVPVYSARERANMCVQWIRVMNAMHELCNYEGILPVYIAVDAILTRDEETNKLIPKDYVEKKAKLRTLVGPSNNYSGYRQERNHANPSLPFVPLQCVILKDLVFIEESDNLEEDGSLNWWKFSFIADNLEKLRKAKFNIYNFSEHPEVKLAVIQSYSMRLDSFQLDLLIKEKWDVSRDTLKGMKKHNRSGGTIRLKNLFPKHSLSSQNLNARLVMDDGVESPEKEINELEHQANTQLTGGLAIDDSSLRAKTPPPITLNAAIELHDATFPAAINNQSASHVPSHLVGSPSSMSSDSLGRKDNKQLLKAGERGSTSSPRLSSKKEKALEKEREKQMERERAEAHGSSPMNSNNTRDRSPRALSHERTASLPLLGSVFVGGASDGEKSPKEKDRSPRREHLLLSLPHLHSRSMSKIEMSTTVTTTTEAATIEIVTDKEEFIQAREHQQRMLMELQHNILGVTANPEDTLVPLSTNAHSAHVSANSASLDASSSSKKKELDGKELLIMQLENPFASRGPSLFDEVALKPVQDRQSPPLSPHQETTIITATSPIASPSGSPQQAGERERETVVGESSAVTSVSGTIPAHHPLPTSHHHHHDLPSSASSPALKFKKRPTAEPRDGGDSGKSPVETVKKSGNRGSSGSSGGKRSSESRALQKAASFRDKESPKMVLLPSELSSSAHDENDRCFANQQPMSEFLSRMHSIQLSPGIIAKAGTGSDEKETKREKKEQRIILRSSSSDSPTKFKQIEHRESADAANTESAIARKKLVLDFDNSDGKTLPRRRQSEKHRRLKRDKDKDGFSGKSKLHSSLGGELALDPSAATTTLSSPQLQLHTHVAMNSSLLASSGAGSGSSSSLLPTSVDTATTTTAVTNSAATDLPPTESERSVTEGMDDDVWVHLEMQKILENTIYRTPRDGPLRDSGSSSVQGSNESFGGGVTGESASATTIAPTGVAMMDNGQNETGGPTTNGEIDSGQASPLTSEELQSIAAKKVTRRRTDQL